MHVAPPYVIFITRVAPRLEKERFLLEALSDFPQTVGDADKIGMMFKETRLS